MVIRTLLGLWAIIRRCFVIPSNRSDGCLDLYLVSGLDIRVFNRFMVGLGVGGPVTRGVPR